MARKGKDAKLEEWYLGQIRQLKSENRNLKKRLKQLEKNHRVYEDLKLDQEEHEEIELEKETYKKLESCTSCGKGKLEEFEIMEKTYGTCNVCGERKRLR